MDALELQAALVKLDPATTVTPITSNVKLMSSHHRIAFAVDVDDDDLTLRRNTLEVDEKQSIGVGNCSSSSVEHQQSSSSTITTTSSTGGTVTNATRKLQNANCGGASLTMTTTTTNTTTHQNHHTSQQQMGVSKCNLVEVR
ncbi:PREDICTED: uncharacterized protein LOC106784483 [Polistes canadensis]|uniref:uncharacterized protein LOC106784483 n=1 Tax=Polistes canadensis TaxID=91411 RepID=UPI000718D208|nr:PREDICTED: uncharacterized protein LOC106784483 [Polistes canadensis]KAI4479975.1 hypothetical protein M0804_010714 [Polistes exclamans]